LVDERVGRVQPIHRTPGTAVLCVGLATAVCMLLGGAILVPVTEVGSVASAIGWTASCAAYLRLRNKGGFASISRTGFAVAGFGLLVAIAMLLMKIVPAVPGHFTNYEWLALGVWIVLGLASWRRASLKSPKAPA
ncbi:MAG TPA: hypothetical protein VND65_06705, partial [Candidatus Binatia bacterium]|nr:hypothetical protein [Candidatus Binatia bacterium]